MKLKQLLCATAVLVHGAFHPVLAAEKTGVRVVDSFEVGDNVYVRALTVEKGSNTLWVGTSVGAHEIDLKTSKPRNTFTRQQGLANEYVFAVGIDTEGYKWFGTNAGGASRYKDGKWKTYFPMHGLADYWIYSFANDKAGNLWIGTWAGVNHYNVKTGKFKTYVKELINEWVYGLSVDNDGKVWFGTEGGVSMYDGKRWRSWTHKDGLGADNVNNLQASANTGLGTRSRHDLTTQVEGLSSYNPNYTFSIHAAPDGVIWAGTWGGGVSRYDGKRWTNLTTQDGLAGNIVYSMAQDDKGVFWFGTDKGLSRYDGKTWKNLGKADGLFDTHVYAVTVAPNGDIWAGTKRGVVRVAPQ
ncbi:regulator [Dechloromonas sp. XY25]|uniref:Regulator n=1 Tax=Dechloromonas hankyongensis TaxID=2908002 RepID=A0ABS9K1Y0_9RHOO|nr:two-component regulator propeller domain-containing protein [Dechloromonas hankyongensis]MCG2577189.1 regulator [Dechloromonas hankyongensis]